MNVETIGLWAGAVWNSLNEANGTQDMKGLKKVTKLKEKEVFAAIGWLAREGKVSVASDDEGKQIEVTLL
jgi:hypothetical protein